MIKRHPLAVTALAISLICTGCSGASEPEAPPSDVATEGATPPDGFQFSMTESVQLDVVVQLDGSVVRGATVQLTSAPNPSGDLTLDAPSGATTYFSGTTNADGEILTLVPLPMDLTEAELVVDLGGATGPYTDEDARTNAGLFAASSRVTYSRSAFAGSLLVDLVTL